MPDPLKLPNLEALMDEGEITLGHLYPVGGTAVATDGYNCLAMLKRRPNESLTALLQRLDSAVALAVQKNIYTDEINTPPSSNPISKKPR